LSGILPPPCGPTEMQLHLTDSNLPDYLRARGVLQSGDAVSVEEAGDGNINWVRRVTLGGGGRPRPGSWIVKQARPALERFPEYRVSTGRILFEARYLERTRRFDWDGVLPAVHGFDPEARVLILEDLGDAERLDHALTRGADATGPAVRLASFLGRVHAGTREPELANAFANDAMRRLHGDHIFALPLRPNDFPLEPAVLERARALQEDAALVALADAAYARYLEPRGALVHGDVQAGNVLLGAFGPKLLDAEIAHVGDPAFDVGTLIAHLLLPALAREAPEPALPAAEAAWDAYRAARGADGAAFADVARYAGLECLRRTIGAARVPAVATPRASLAVLERAEAWIRRPPSGPSSLGG
jgi:5-methylthioribose kinase